MLLLLLQIRRVCRRGPELWLPTLPPSGGLVRSFIRAVDNLLSVNYEECSVSLPAFRSLMKSPTCKEKKKKNSAAQVNPQISIFTFSLLNLKVWH